MIHLLLRYIGIKTKLLDEIKKEIDKIAPDGEGVLDMFAGSTVVGQTVMDKHIVYSNDIQNYSRVAAETLIHIDNNFDYDSLDYRKITESKYFKDNLNYLFSIFNIPLHYEKELFKKTGKNLDNLSYLKEFKFYYEHAPYSGHFSSDVSAFKGMDDVYSIDFYKQCKDNKNSGYWCLFSLVYGVPYFSLEQSMFIDSFRYAVEKLYCNKEITFAEYNAYISMAIYVLENTVTSVGDHFAQPQQFKISGEARLQREVKKILSKKTKNLHLILDEINEQLKTIKPTLYSHKNKVFCEDYASLFENNAIKLKDISTIYIDPPYTNAHYSRFYHILETLVLYDYPNIEFFGRYRSDRYQSPFCIRSEALEEFNRMIKLCHDNKKKIVISYSDTSQCILKRSEIEQIVKKHYQNVKIKEIDYLYRNFGQKPNKVKGNELLIICK